MVSNENLKLLKNNITFFYNNLTTLISLRPDIKYTFKEKGMVVSQKSNFKMKEGINGFEELIKKEQLQRTLNSAIILNCFSLFESSFEWRLLHELNTKGLSGIQEKIMLKYIDGVIKISSIDNYLKEYRFITGKSLNESLNTDEHMLFNVIKKFYVMRNILIHGSSIKEEFIKENQGGWIKLDKDNEDYHIFFEMIKEKINLGVSYHNFSLDLVLLVNNITDLLLNATLNIANKLSTGTNTIFIKGKPL